MKAFAELLDRLAYTPSRNDKLRLLADYFAATPDPDRGFALAALTDGLFFRLPLRRILTELLEPRVDPVLFDLSRDYVGDTAETIALIWPGGTHRRRSRRGLPRSSRRCRRRRRREVPALLANWLDQLDATGRWALLKLMTGALRVGVSARLAKTALAEWSGVPLADIEEVWHGARAALRGAVRLALPAQGRAPDVGTRRDVPAADAVASDRGQGACRRSSPRTSSPNGNGTASACRPPIKAARSGSSRAPATTSRAPFPDVVEALPEGVVLDGELLVVRDGEVAPFNDLQQRLNRKSVTAAMLKSHPAHIRLYDMLFEGERGSAPAALHRAARAARGLAPGAWPAPHRCLRHHRLRLDRGARERCGPARARPASKG